MIERPLGTPDVKALETTVVQAPLQFADFFHAEHARLFGALCFVTGDRHEAEEVMQDAFLRMWERWDEGRFDDPSAYLFRTAMNVSGTGTGARRSVCAGHSASPRATTRSRTSTTAITSFARSASSRRINAPPCS